MLLVSRLPVKSLLRFKSVCKEWDSLISNNHDFAKLQLQFQRTTTCNNNQYYCLVEEFPKPGTQNSCSCCGNRLLSLKLEVGAVAIAEMRKFPCNGSVVGSSNGLICLSHDICYKKLEDTKITRITLSYEIWNPATGGRWHIPAPPRVLDHHDICVGFGYISSLDDYKIVILKSRTYVYPTKQIHHVMTYSCSTNTWKQIEQRDEKPDYLEYGAASGIQVGESLHWGLRGRAASNPVHPIVLAFNLGNDLIHWLRVSLPDPEWPLPTRYFVFKDGGHLCVSWANNKRCDRSYKEVDDTVFMLDDDGSKWKQIFTFEDVQCLYPHRHISDTHSTVGIVNHGRILVYITAATSGGPEKLAVQQQLDTPDPVSLLIRTNDHIQTLITPFTSRRRPTTILPIVDPSKK